MTEIDRTFGVPDSIDDAPQSPLDDLVAEFSKPIERITTVRFSIDGRPGWWAEYDTGFKIGRLAKVLAPKRGKDPDILQGAFVVIGESCIAIGKGDDVVFDSETVQTPDGVQRRGPFLNGQVQRALGDVQSAPGERPWQTAIRATYGAMDDDRVIIALLNELQAANAAEVVRADEANPTD